MQTSLILIYRIKFSNNAIYFELIVMSEFFIGDDKNNNEIISFVIFHKTLVQIIDLIFFLNRSK